MSSTPASLNPADLTCNLPPIDPATGLIAGTKRKRSKAIPKIVSLSEARYTLQHGAQVPIPQLAPEVEEAEEATQAPVTQTVVAPSPAAAQEAPSPMSRYLSKRTRVTMNLSEGTMVLPALDFLVTETSITVLFRLRDDAITFIPKAGVELKLSHGDRTFGCYYPGAHFEIDDLNVLGLTFIRTEGGG